MSGGNFRWRNAPERASMRVQDWPALHRELWIASLRVGDPIDGGGGSRTTQRKITNQAVERGYGRFLTFLVVGGYLDTGVHPADCITAETVRDYVLELQRLGNKPGTIHVRLEHLREMAKVFDSGRDWSFIAKAMAHMHSLRTGRDPFCNGRLVTSDELLDLGIRLMDQARLVPDRARSLGQFRDGLLIAFLSIVPIRISNLAALTIDVSLVRVGEEWAVSLPSEVTKTHRALHYSWPEFLTSQLEDYIGNFRQKLTQRKGRWTSDPGQRLWVSSDGSAMTQTAINDRLAARTLVAFGFPMRAHAFRHAATTTFAVEDPANVRAAAPLLGHSSYGTTERSYNVAKSLEATRLFAAAIGHRQIPKRGKQV